MTAPSLRAVMRRVPKIESEVASYEATMRESFERRYRENRDSCSVDDSGAEAAHELLSRLPSAVSCTVLDIGTGRGRDLELFVVAGHRATGIDIIAPDNWPGLRERWGDSVALVETSLQAYAAEERFDAILDNGCFHHQHPDEVTAYVERIHDCLAPGGIALFSVYTPLVSTDDGALLLDGDGRLHRELSLLEMQEHLSFGGLVAIDARKVQRSGGGKLLFVVCMRIEDVARRSPPRIFDTTTSEVM